MPATRLVSTFAVKLIDRSRLGESLALSGFSELSLIPAAPAPASRGFDSTRICAAAYKPVAGERYPVSAFENGARFSWDFTKSAPTSTFDARRP
jgi:hypothetical protein